MMSKSIFQKSKKALSIAVAATALFASQSSLATILTGDYTFNNNRQGAETLTWDGGSTATITGETNKGLGYVIEYHGVELLKNKVNNFDWLVAKTGQITFEGGNTKDVYQHRGYALYLKENENLRVHNWTPRLGDIHSNVTYVQPPVPVPAPASILLLGLGLAGAGLLKKKKK